MATFVTLDEAKAHLGQSWEASDPREADLQMKLNAAEGTLLRLVDPDILAVWTPETVPPDIKAMILVQAGVFWGFTGEGPDGPPIDPTVSADFILAVASLLRRYQIFAI